MKKFIVLGFASLFFAAASHAQSDGGSNGGRGNYAQNLQAREDREAKALNLSDDQKAQFAAIDKAQLVSMDSLRNAGSADRRGGMMTIMKNTNDQKRALLNADQQAKWDDLQQKRQQRMQQRQNGGGDNSGGN